MPTRKSLGSGGKTLRSDYESWPGCFEEALGFQVQLPRVAKVHRIVFAGMGGSAVAGEVVRDWLSSYSAAQIEVVKDYHLPEYVDSSSLLVAVSCSGDTEETVSVLIEAVNRGVPAATISSGGILRNIADKYHIPHTNVKRLSAPRSSLPYMLPAAARIATHVLDLGENEKDLLKCLDVLKKMKRTLSREDSLRNNPSGALAEHLVRGRVLIYTPLALLSAATRFKNSLNENAKTHSSVEVIPELCHNEIEAWRKNGETRIPVFLRYRGEPPKVEERVEAIQSIMLASGSKPFDVWARGQNSLSRIMSIIYLLDYSTVYLAEKLGIDPLPTPNIDFLKNRLRSKLRYLERFASLNIQRE